MIKNSKVGAWVIVLITLMSANVFAQSVPAGINYQAIARNSSGSVFVNSNVSVRISILQGSGNGLTQYSETHQALTNQFGLFNLKIGNGTPLSGDFNSIPWNEANQWVKIEVDPSGGSNYQEVGSSELLSVPFALYAQSTPAQPDAKRSSLKFKAYTSIGDAQGTFKVWSVSGSVDPERFESSQVTVELDAKSVDTGSSMRDKHLRDEDFFWAERHPKLRFVTSSILPAKAADTYIVTGDLTIRGVTKRLSLLMTTARQTSGDQQRLRVKGNVRLKRSEHGLTYKSGFFEPTLKDEVDLMIDLTFILP